MAGQSTISNLRRLRPAALHRMEQLPQRLHAIENARRRLAHNRGFMGSDHQNVAFLVRLRGELQPRLLQNLLAGRAIGPRQNNAREPFPLPAATPSSELRSSERSDAAKRSSSVLLVTSMLTRVPDLKLPWPSSS